MKRTLINNPIKLKVQGQPYYTERCAEDEETTAKAKVVSEAKES